MIPRGGEGGMRRREHVPPRTITPLLQATMAPGPCLDTDADAIDRRLEPGGDAPASVGHSRGEDARDADGEGVHAVHVQTLEGLCSRRRSWLRPHRGLSPDHWPLYVGFCAFVHNVRRRGKA